VGGASRSKHLNGAAFDIAMSNHDPVAFEAAARAVGFLGFGYYPRSGFMHVDLGTARHWGERFLVQSVPFAPRARGSGGKPHAARQWRRWRGQCGSAAGRPRGNQSTIEPLMPHLGTLRWVLIVIALR